MTYTFKSKACGDVLMLRTDGDRVLSAMGIEPAPKGIILPLAMPAAIKAIGAVIDRDDSRQRQSQMGADCADASASNDEGVSLRQRAWPLVEMMKRAHAEGEAIVWGV
jgi:hypothetical protein